jgi:folylpolyglutamate synthase/dihydropteroate synthase
VAGVVAALAGAACLRGARVGCTTLDMTRAMTAETLATHWARASRGRGVDVRVEPDLDVALQRALETAPGPVVVAGSLYLVGAVRARLVHEPLLEDPVDDPVEEASR